MELCMTNNRVLRVFLIVAIGAGLGFLDYKTPVKSKELEVLDLVAEVLVANHLSKGNLPETLKEAGYGNIGNSILNYQKVSDKEFSLAYSHRDFYIDQNRKFHAPNVFLGFKLFIWEKMKLVLEFYYLFIIVFGVYAVYSMMRTTYGRSLDTTGR